MPYADPEQRRAYHRANDQTPARAARRRAARPDWDRAAHANKRAREFGVPGTITAADAREILAGGRCHWCGRVGRVELDHVIPMRHGGPNTRENIVASCRPCNTSKRNGPRPWRWCQVADECIRCGRSDSRHASGGLCNACYQRDRKSA